MAISKDQEPLLRTRIAVRAVQAVSAVRVLEGSSHSEASPAGIAAPARASRVRAESGVTVDPVAGSPARAGRAGRRCGVVPRLQSHRVNVDRRQVQMDFVAGAAARVPVLSPGL